ncbi:MAG: cytochrome c oxidase subunit 3 [Sporichthyaceae bacterium]
MTTTSTSTETEPRERREHIPGEPGLWVFLLGDMVVFGLFFGVLVVFSGQHPDLFGSGQDALHLELGVINTVVLLTSSLLVAHGLRLARAFHPKAWMFFVGALLCGAIFAGVKAIEYTDLGTSGHTPPTNDFFMYYFVFTGIHLGHVVLGMGALAAAAKLSRPGPHGPHRSTWLEGVACFWHLVDLLWIMLFALLYLMQ